MGRRGQGNVGHSEVSARSGCQVRHLFDECHVAGNAHLRVLNPLVRDRLGVWWWQLRSDTRQLMDAAAHERRQLVRVQRHDLYVLLRKAETQKQLGLPARALVYRRRSFAWR